MNRRTTLLAALVLAACTADLPTAPTEAAGPSLQAAFPPVPPPPTPLSATLPGANGAPVTVELGVWETPILAQVTVRGMLSYSGATGGYYAPAGSHDFQGRYIPAGNLCASQLSVRIHGVGPVGGAFGYCPASWQRLGSLTRYAVISGAIYATRTSPAPGACYYGTPGCATITGSQEVTVTPVEGTVAVLPETTIVRPGAHTFVRFRAVPVQVGGMGLPFTLREVTFVGSGPVVGGGTTQPCGMRPRPTECIGQFYQSGYVEGTALVSGVLRTGRAWITVVGGDSVPPPPVDTIPGDTIPTDTLPPGGGDGGGGCSAGVPTGVAGALAACEPPDDTVKVPSVRVASGVPLMLPVLAHLFNARTQGARNKLANGARAPAERSDVVTVEVDVKTDRGTPTGASVWVVSSPVAGSGGHYHFDPDAVGIARPRGTFFPFSAGTPQFMDSVGGTRDSILIAVPDTGAVRLHYRSSGLGGQEWISVRVAGADAAAGPRDSLSVLVAWPALSRMSWEGTAYIFNHSSNHAGGDDYAAPGVGSLLDSILTMYRDRHDLDPETYPMTGQVFTVDAATLSHGGLYDIGWSSEEIWRYPHEQHRTGLDVDVNNTLTEGVPGQMQQVCGSFYYSMSATVRLKVYCELHNNNHYHIFFGPMRPRSAPR